MPNTPILALPYPVPSAPADVPADIEALAAKLDVVIPTTPAWIAPTLINSWINVPGNVPVHAAYLKDAMGWVHLRGRLGGGTSGTTAWTLPAGYRPGYGGQTVGTFAACALDGANVPVAAAVAIDTAGNVVLFYAAGTSEVSVGGISFLAES